MTWIFKPNLHSQADDGGITLGSATNLSAASIQTEEKGGDAVYLGAYLNKNAFLGIVQHL
jgi:hypothetical protein